MGAEATVEKAPGFTGDITVLTDMVVLNSYSGREDQTRQRVSYDSKQLSFRDGVLVNVKDVPGPSETIVIAGRV